MISSSSTPLDMIADFHRRDHLFVTVCYAQTLDGSISTESGETLLISGPESMRLTHRLRAVHDGILVGVNTVLADNPRLNVRLVEGQNPRPLILDSRLRTPPNARLFSTGARPIIFTSQRADADLAKKLVASGATIVRLAVDEDGRLSLVDLLASLSKHGIQSVMVEGGAQVLTSFLDLGLADGVVVTVSPQFVGGIKAIGRRLHGVPRIRQASFLRYGEDIVVWGAVGPLS